VFANLLNVVSRGEASCLQFKGGICVLANSCAHYD